MAFRSTAGWANMMWKLSLSGIFILLCVYNVQPAKVLVGADCGGYKLFSADVDVNLDHLDFTLLKTTFGQIFGITRNPNTQDIYFTEDKYGIQKCDIYTMMCQQIVDLTATNLQGIAEYNDTLYYVDNTDLIIYKTNEDGQKESIYTHQDWLLGIDIDRRDSVIYFIDHSNQKVISMDVEGQDVSDVITGIVKLKNVEIDQTSRDLYIGTDDASNGKIIRLNLDSKEQTVVYNEGILIHDLAILNHWILYVEWNTGLKVVDMSGIPHSVTVTGLEGCGSHRSIHVIENKTDEISTTNDASMSDVITTTPGQVETTDSPDTVTTNPGGHTTETFSTAPTQVQTTDSNTIMNTDGNSLNTVTTKPGDHTNVGSLSVASSNTSVAAKITTKDRVVTTEEIAENHSTVTDMFSTKWTLNINKTCQDVQEEDLLSAFEIFTSVFPASLEVGVIVNDTQIEMVKYKLEPVEQEFLVDHGDSDYKQPLTVSLIAAFMNAESNNSGFVTIILLKTPNGVQDLEKDDKNQVVGSPLLSINFFNETGNLVKHENEQHPFNITFPIQQLNETYTENQPRRVCSFWDNDNKYWSQEGAFTFDQISEASFQTCAFTHLTTFAVLFDFSKDDNRVYSPIAEIFTMIGSSISVIFLCIGLVIFALLWKRPPIDKEKMIIHCQLMIVMAIAYILNMVTKAGKLNQTVCLVIAIFRYNMFLNMFSIMFIEAVHLFRMIVIVFGGQRNFRAIYAAISFGFPICLTIITASIGQDQLHDAQSCWLAREYIWNFIAPVAALLTANVLILVIVIRQTLLVAGEDRMQSARISLRSTLLLLPMLGTSWLIGLLANLSLVATYIFDIIISLQGVYLVVVIFVINSEVRNATLEWFRAHVGTPQLNAGMHLRRVQVQPALPEVAD